MLARSQWAGWRWRIVRDCQPTDVSNAGVIVVTGRVKIRNAFKLYGERLADAQYNASVFSIISYTAAILILLIIGWAITDKVIHVPVFHPDIPITSG